MGEPELEDFNSDDDDDQDDEEGLEPNPEAEPEGIYLRLPSIL